MRSAAPPPKTVLPGPRGTYARAQLTRVRGVVHDRHGLQARLEAGPPDVAYGREAGAVRDQVMHTTEAEPGEHAPVAECGRLVLQRACAQGQDKMRKQPPDALDEKNLWAEAWTDKGEVPVVDDRLEARIRALKGRGRPLSRSVRSFLEPRFGHNFGHVRVHADDASARLARRMDARAFTVGRDLVFGEDEFAPETKEGRRLLAHELAHVVQQGCGQWSAASGTRLTEDPYLQGGSSHDSIQMMPLLPNPGIPVDFCIQRQEGALSNQLAIHRRQAIARVTRARKEGARAFGRARGANASIVRASQQALRNVDAWRHTVDARALGQVVTNYEGVILGGAQYAAGEALDALSRAHPVAAVVYKVIKGVITVGQLAHEAARVLENRALVGASDEAQELSMDTQDDILAQILRGQQSALTVFAILYGQLVSTVSERPGGGLRLALAPASREAAQAESLESEGGPGPRDIDIQDLEESGLNLLEVADVADQLVELLNRALGVLEQSPTEIRNRGRRALMMTQSLFVGASPEGELRLEGDLIREFPDRRILDVDPHIGSGPRRTVLASQSTWRDLSVLGIPVTLELELRVGGPWPRPFARPQWERLSIGQSVTVRQAGSELFRWEGPDDASIGQFMIGHSWDGDNRSEAEAVAVGRIIKLQIQNMLSTVPLADLDEMDV